jgi:hypothetical protein
MRREREWKSDLFVGKTGLGNGPVRIRFNLLPPPTLEHEPILTVADSGGISLQAVEEEEEKKSQENYIFERES